MSNNYLIKIPIIRKNYDKTNSAKFKGFIKIITNEYGVIKDWNIDFNEIYVDVFTTQRWFNEPNTIFNIRTKLFKILNLVQIKRPDKNSTQLIKLNDDQIAEFNSFINDRDLYKSTIKNIVGIIKGNNPGGEAKKPSSAEMIIDTNESVNNSLKNFVILLDDLVEKDNNHFLPFSINAKEMQLNKFVKLNPTIEAAFKYMQEQKGENDFTIYLNNIKKFYKTYNSYAEKAERIVKKERQKYNIAVPKYYLKNNVSLPFDFKIENTDEFQKCHIYEVYALKSKITNLLYENKKSEALKIALKISDPENFIPLPEEIHRKFDRHIFTFVPSKGNAVPLNEEGQKYINEKLDKRFLQINKQFLTKKKMAFFQERNEI